MFFCLQFVEFFYKLINKLCMDFSQNLSTSFLAFLREIQEIIHNYFSYP